jgi:tryptophan-rich sensory protein
MWNVDCTIALVVDVVLCAIAITTGWVVNHGLSRHWREWYHSLPKSRATPPPIVFSIVWTALYLCIAAAGITARFYYEQPANTATYAISVASQVMYYCQWGLNIAWAPIFFLGQAPTVALVVLFLTFGTSTSAMVLFFLIKWVPGLLMSFYVFWLFFALFLNLRIVMKLMNHYTEGGFKIEQKEEIDIRSEMSAPKHPKNGKHARRNATEILI